MVALHAIHDAPRGTPASLWGLGHHQTTQSGLWRVGQFQDTRSGLWGVVLVGTISGSDITEGTIKKARLPSDVIYGVSSAATETVAGVVELATTTETTTGTDTTRATTPADMKAAIDARTATDTAAGIVELATTAEAVTGTDTVRAVTPAGVKAAVNAVGTSTGVAYSAGWADYGGGYTPVTWYRDKDGYIRLSGLFKRTGATITAGPSGTIFTLPVGARPVGSEAFIQNKDDVSKGLAVGSTGVVSAGGALGTWTSGSSYMYVSGVMFKAA